MNCVLFSKKGTGKWKLVYRFLYTIVMSEDIVEIKKPPQDIFAVLDQARADLSADAQIDLPVGNYFIPEGMRMTPIYRGSGLDTDSRKPAKVVVADLQNSLAGAFDPITGDPIKEGEKVVLLGTFEIAVTLDTFDALVQGF
jgi:hypothetical protein